MPQEVVAAQPHGTQIKTPLLLKWMRKDGCQLRGSESGKPQSSTANAEWLHLKQRLLARTAPMDCVGTRRRPACRRGSHPPHLRDRVHPLRALVDPCRALVQYSERFTCHVVWQLGQA